jgi:hypothetical protein
LGGAVSGLQGSDDNNHSSISGLQGSDDNRYSYVSGLQGAGEKKRLCTKPFTVLFMPLLVRAGWCFILQQWINLFSWDEEDMSYLTSAHSAITR